MTEAIRTDGLVKRYGWLPGAASRRAAVDGLELRVPAGGITGLLGPNGAGKSTAVKLLLGLARPTAGTAKVFGRDPWRESLAVRREVAFVPEERAVFGWMRTADFIARVARLSPRWDATVASRLARRWEIDGAARMRTLSQGTRSRVLLLVALARRARLLLLDEPTTGLDPAAVDDALGELVQAAADGATVLLVTHRLDEVERICDRVAVMSEGRAVLQGDLDDLRATWRVIDVAGHPAPQRLASWDEVAGISPHGEQARLWVRAQPDAVLDRLRLLGAEVTAVRHLSLREIYLAATGADDAGSDDLA